MHQFWWLVLIIIGVVIHYTPHLDVVFSISLSIIIIVLGVFGLIKSLFH